MHNHFQHYKKLMTTAEVSIIYIRSHCLCCVVPVMWGNNLCLILDEAGWTAWPRRLAVK